ncbi:MAG: PorP/SprF family type IX secretion system membrane protein [Crocinitomicaceae bacterium]|nr:PorP/SprF family type IX secretion system membrane protein [Crocinitomicaceae bacterium]
MKLKIISVLTLTLLTLQNTSNILAQDIHFSQASNSPLTLNPALAGANNVTQAIINYRTQWSSVATPFNTIAASFDTRLNEGSRQRKGIFALGLNLFNDQAGDLKLATTNANLNLAYHLIINKKSTIGGGIYAGFGQRSISASDGQWASQFNGDYYDANIQSGESVFADKINYFDVGTGFVYTYKGSENYMTSNNQKDYNIGFAIYHLNRPDYSFMSANNEQLYMRFSGFANAIIGISNTRNSLMPAIYFQRQNSAKEFLFGTYWRYRIQEASRVTGYNKGSYLSLGAFYRANDAFVAKAMLEMFDYSVGFAYDINVSSLTRVSRAKGGFELFLKYSLAKNIGGKRSRF